MSWHTAAHDADMNTSTDLPHNNGTEDAMHVASSRTHKRAQAAGSALGIIRDAASYLVSQYAPPPDICFQDVGDEKPGGVLELRNSQLAAALKDKTEFYEDDLLAFGIDYLPPQICIMSEGRYYLYTTKRQQPQDPSPEDSGDYTDSGQESENMETDINLIPSSASMLKNVSTLLGLKDRDAWHRLQKVMRDTDGNAKKTQARINKIWQGPGSDDEKVEKIVELLRRHAIQEHREHKSITLKGGRSKKLTTRNIVKQVSKNKEKTEAVAQALGVIRSHQNQIRSQNQEQTEAVTKALGEIQNNQNNIKSSLDKAVSGMATAIKDGVSGAIDDQREKMEARRTEAKRKRPEEGTVFASIPRERLLDIVQIAHPGKRATPMEIQQAGLAFTIIRGMAEQMKHDYVKRFRCNVPSNPIVTVETMDILTKEIVVAFKLFEMCYKSQWTRNSTQKRLEVDLLLGIKAVVEGALKAS